MSELKQSLALLKEAKEILGSSVKYPDPEYQGVVEDLGDRIGYGALMHAANWGWQQANKRRGIPEGSEFTLGYCAGTVEPLKKKIDDFINCHQHAGSKAGE